MKLLKSALIATSLAMMPLAASAQTAAPSAPAANATAPAAADIAAAPPANAVTAAPAEAAAPAAASAAAPADGKKVELPAAPAPLDAKAGVGQPQDGHKFIGLQPQVTEIGERAAGLHNALLYYIFGISIFVLGLLAWVMIRYNERANPNPSKVSHNTWLEVAWTAIPALSLVFIAIPSLGLLAAQYKPPSKDAVTVKIIGHQWQWSYKYPDYGDFEIYSKMLTKEQAIKPNEPYLLGVDNRMVVPVDTEIKAIVTSEDVIHSWTVPAFWTKMDAIPGRLNETTFKVKAGKEGVYYGQCSELCGVRHGFMPIAVEVVSKENFAKWIASKGGKLPGATAAAPAPPAKPAA